MRIVNRDWELVLLFIILATGAYSILPRQMSRFSIRQAINLPALQFLKNVIQRPELAVPYVELSKLSDLNLHKLKKQGIRCLLFDKDNTLR